MKSGFRLRDLARRSWPKIESDRRKERSRLVIT